MRGMGDIVLEPNREGAPFSFRERGYGRKPIVEIGFGNGEFLEHLAAANTENPVVGMEVSLTCVAKAIRRIERLGLGNAFLLRGDARFLLRECFSDEGVARVHMNFPCPWPKMRHARRRVTAEGFANTLAAVLEIGGTFELVTDEEWYAEEVARVLDRHAALASGDVVVDPHRVISTKYERKWLAMEKRIFGVTVTKNAPWTVERLVKGSDTMHLDIACDAPLTDRLPSLAGIEGEEGSAHWVVREWFLGHDGVGLLRVIATDEGFEQRFLLRLVPRRGSVLIKIDSVGDPFRTPAVRFAMERVGAALAGKAI